MSEPVHRINETSSYGYALQMTPNYGGITLVEHGGGQPGDHPISDLYVKKEL